MTAVKHLRGGHPKPLDAQALALANGQHDLGQRARGLNLRTFHVRKSKTDGSIRSPGSGILRDLTGKGQVMLLKFRACGFIAC